jgi:hypothetical protein
MKRRLILITIFVVVILALGFLAHTFNLLGLIKAMHHM